jgi:UDP-GlcNAc:undecaprenyl-phosphate/decaprenyl-phosphate GlcNAc-1-phosphate transferase
MDLIIIFYLSLLLTVFSTPVFIDYFSKNQIMDFPGERRINTYAVPRMGGIVIYLTAIISIIGFFNDLTQLRFFILGSLSLLLLGIFDDIKDVSYQKKFVIQFIAALFLLIFLSDTYNSISLFGFKIPFPLDKILLMIFIVGVINAINLYDGLDGLVTSFSLLISFITFYFGWELNNQLLLILSASLIGSLIGFLKYNIFPAKIFLGDSGSLTLGFFLITAVLISSTNPATKNIDLTFSIILLAVPVIDTLRVMIGRIANFKNPFLPDLSHIHHIILNSRINYKRTLVILQSFSIIFIVIALYYYKSSEIFCIVFFIMLSIMLFNIRRMILVYRKLKKYARLKKFSLNN